MKMIHDTELHGSIWRGPEYMVDDHIPENIQVDVILGASTDSIDQEEIDIIRDQIEEDGTSKE